MPEAQVVPGEREMLLFVIGETEAQGLCEHLSPGPVSLPCAK